MSIIMLMLLAFMNVRFTESWHFHARVLDIGDNITETHSHTDINPQESCSLCQASHHEIPFLKAPQEFFFFKSTEVPVHREKVLKISSIFLSTPSRAPPALL